ncbi:HNH endonuclease [Sediminibacillus halophilus]|uniref:HNH endonuclease n=1 Tax=Sediminibacillus halophilus TaxID=482461 RepID=A0A1G9QX29_9BACI|nr:HNH endonuclease [Sediminibacillus halophilus]SDM15421.1 HNH endonuclease [Sediminibacillus halophilus]
MNPYSKADQLYTYKKPTLARRTEFTKKQRKEIDRIYGETCVVCMNPCVSYHHRKFRSQGGRNNPRNGAPLCEGCHRYVHEHPEAAEDLRQEAIKRFGPYYYFDKYDCWKQGLIDAPDNRKFETFMESEELKASKL